MITRYHLFALSFLGLAVLTSLPIEKGLSQASFSFSLDNSLQRILGSATEAVGDVLFLKADDYFHGGVKEKFHEEGESMRTEGDIPEDRDEERAPADWIAKINEQVTSHTHRHLSSDKIQELLPFFALSTTLDPHNVEALLTTAFWLDKSFSKTDEAIDVLRNGIEKNPASWELESEIARLYLLRKKDSVSSERHYLEALRKSKDLKADGYKAFDMRYFLAEAYALDGNKAQALAFYQEALNFFDTKKPLALRQSILDKINKLSS